MITLSMSELEKIGQLRCLETDKKLAESLTDNDTLSRARETLIESMTPSEMLKKLQISTRRRAERTINNTNFTQAAMPDPSPPKRFGSKCLQNDGSLNFYNQGIHHEIIAEESIGTADIENQKRNIFTIEVKSNQSDWE